MMDSRSVLSHLGVILEITGILTLVPVLVSRIFNEDVHMLFFIAAVCSFSIGLILDRRFEKREIDLSSAMVISALSFVLISVFGSLPYLAYLNPLDAVFESVSGFTTTGLTVVNPENLPHTLVFWRSFTQWIGGIGILVIFLLLVGSPGMSSYYLYRAEGIPEKIEASIKNSVKRIFTIYTIYTIAGIVLLAAAGMPLFDSCITAFSSVSTGGFTARDGSIGAYANPMIEVVVIFLMVLGGTSFFVHDKILRKKFRGYVSNPETKLFWFIILISLIPLSLSFAYTGSAVRDGVFHSFSALTTTGFTTLTDTPSDVSQVFLVILMIVGGYAGSTAGGLKLVRSGIIAKSLAWLGKKISLPPEAVVPLKFGDRTVRNDELNIISMFLILYFLVMFVSALVIISLGYSPINALFQVASAEGTVGLSVTDTAAMHWSGKIVLMADMLLGRLEIIPFLVLAYVLYRQITGRERESA